MSANWLRSAGLFLSPGLSTGAPGLLSSALRAVAIMLCTRPTSDVCTPLPVAFSRRKQALSGFQAPAGAKLLWPFTAPEFCTRQPGPMPWREEAT